jgi:hypothetical protein
VTALRGPGLRRFVVGSFADPEALLHATAELRGKGLGIVDTYTPYPVPGLERALGTRRARVPLLVLVGGLLGAVTGYLLIYFTNVVDWPLNVGNRPPHSPPTHIPVTFEMGVLFGAGFAFFGLLLLLGLPRPYHPVFQAAAFGRSAVDSFVVSVELAAGADGPRARDDLAALGASDVELVEEWER